MTRRINARLKTVTIAAEPPIDDDPLDLDPTFRTKLDTALAELAARGVDFVLVEGFRTVDRQQWLYGSGRPGAKPYGRPGSVLTNADGVAKRSSHQGSGVRGTGRAADCYPQKGGSTYIPPATDPVWKQYANAVEAAGLVAGLYIPKLVDAPHSELPPDPPAPTAGKRPSSRPTRRRGAARHARTTKR